MFFLKEKVEKEKAVEEEKEYDSDETVVSEDELAKLEITPKRKQPQVNVHSCFNRAATNSTRNSRKS